MEPRVDVLVVGAGPVGLFLARELTRHGFSVRLIEKRAHQSEHSKALAIMPRTLEVFEMAGILGPFVKAANPVTQASLQSDGRVLGTVDLANQQSRFKYIAMVPQDVTEALLRKQLEAVGGHIEYQSELIALDQVDASSSHPVRARVRVSGDDQLQQIRARFAVGCDGAHSSVRHQLGLPFEGNEYPEVFVLADIESTRELPADRMLIAPNRAGAIASFPLSPRRRRIVAMVEPSYEDEPDLAFVNQLLCERGLGELAAERLLWGSRFRIHHRGTPHMRKGRIFLAGDAAHIHSPFGAQGMNTGLQDAWNLAWKLRFVLAGWAHENLLDSYSAERHPIAQRVIRGTDLLTRAMATRSSTVAAVRNRLLSTVTQLDVLRSLFVATLSELNLNYKHSEIVIGRGARASDEAIGGAGGQLYQALGQGYVLVVPPRLAARRFSTLTTNYPRCLSILQAETAHSRIRLIRPDGYIAYEAGPLTSSLSAIFAIEQLLATQLLSQAPPVPQYGISHAHDLRQ